MATTTSAPTAKQGVANVIVQRHQTPEPTYDGAQENHDTLVLAQTGKRQVLKRRFGVISMTGFALTNAISWEGVVCTMTIGLKNGGPAGVIYGCIFGWFGALSIFTCMGELASMAPTAGGQYHWSHDLASRSWKVPMSYVTGWITVALWTTGAVAGSYTAATTLTELIAFLYPSYQPEPYQDTLVMWAVLVVCMLLNTRLGTVLPSTELFFLAIHIIGFFAFLIPLALMGPNPDSNARKLFTEFNNGGGWSSAGLAFFVGMQGNAASFIGDDCAIHMAEELTDADVNVPRAMLYSLTTNGVLAITLVTVMLYVAAPLDVLATGSQYPFIDITYKGPIRETSAAEYAEHVRGLLRADSSE